MIINKLQTGAGSSQVKTDILPVQGVLLYGLVRQSQQPEEAHLQSVSEPWMHNFATQIETVGVPVQLSL
jgi:hypothetical protein